MSEFTFEVHYVPGTENIIADALSRTYDAEEPGAVSSPPEYTEDDQDARLNQEDYNNITFPMAVGKEANALTLGSRESRKLTEKEPKWLRLRQPGRVPRKPRRLDSRLGQMSGVIPSLVDEIPLEKCVSRRILRPRKLPNE